MKSFLQGLLVALAISVPLVLMVVFVTTMLYSNKIVTRSEDRINVDVKEFIVNADINKPHLFIFGADWCPPCRQMKNNVWPHPDIKEITKNFNVQVLDVSAPENLMYMKQITNNTTTIPTWCVIDLKGNKVYGYHTGGLSVEQLKDWFGKIKVVRSAES